MIGAMTKRQNVREHLEIRLQERLQGGKPRKIYAVGITAGNINRNGRLYPAEVLAAAVEACQRKRREEDAPLHLRQTLGTAGHVTGERIDSVAVRWDSISFDGTRVMLEGVLVPTQAGQNIETLLENGIGVGVSIVGYADSETRYTEDGDEYELITDLEIEAFDLVMDTGDRVAAVTKMETKGGDNMTVNDNRAQQEGYADAAALRAGNPDLYEQIRAEIEQEREAQRLREERAAAQRAAEERRIREEHDRALREQLGIGPHDDLSAAIRERDERLARLEAEEQRRAVASYIEEHVQQVRGLGDDSRRRVAEYVRDDNPSTVEDAQRLLEREIKREEQRLAELKLKLGARGGDVRILGPVIESDVGMPEYAEYAWRVAERLQTRVRGRPWKPAQAKNINERVAAQMLERYTEMYRREMSAERAIISESMTDADNINAPYTMGAVLITTVWPDLIGTSVWDVAAIANNPTRIGFAAYAGESGHTGTVSGEAVTFTALDTEYDLDYKQVTPPLTMSDGYSEGTDFVVDYANGKILALSGGSITAGTSVTVDYTYTAMSTGENVAVQQAAMTITYQTYDVVYSRLADEISHEAMRYSQSQLGMDIAMTVIENISREIQTIIDRGMFYAGLQGALRATNTGGTWTEATDTLQDMIYKIGQAVVAVKSQANKHYMPEVIVVSPKNAHRITTWYQNQAYAPPTATINAAGYVTQLHGLPVFESVNMSDDYVLVAQRDLVMHRVYDPMRMDGPYQGRDATTNKLKATKLWMAETGTITAVPINEKGGYVRIVNS